MSPNDFIILHAFLFYKQHFYKQRKAEIGKKIKQGWDTPWGWTFTIWTLFTFFIHVIVITQKMVGHILGNMQKKKCVCVHDMQLIIMKKKMKKKKKSHSQQIRHKQTYSRQGRKYKYSKYNESSLLVWWRLHILSNA